MRENDGILKTHKDFISCFILWIVCVCICMFFLLVSFCPNSSCTELIYFICDITLQYICIDGCKTETNVALESDNKEYIRMSYCCRCQYKSHRYITIDRMKNWIKNKNIFTAKCFIDMILNYFTANQCLTIF